MGDDDKPDTPNRPCEPESAETLSEAPTVADFDAPPPEELPGGVLTPGEHFGSFEVVRLLGKGGMGEAYDTRTERHVALKVLREGLASESDRERFLREGQLAAQVSHPNSVFVFGSEEIDSTQVIAMELMPGGTLADRLGEQGPLPVEEAVDAILQVISGLEAAQAKGVLHRDIKPSNCFVDADGSVKIGDFGLSIPTGGEARAHRTATGGFVGTPAFASPEQLQGDRELDSRSDIYAVGATLFGLLTGRPPFDASNPAALLARVLTQPPPAVHRVQPATPKALSRVVGACLGKSPEDRPSSYERLRMVLGQYGSEFAGMTWQRRFAAFALDLFLMTLVLFFPVLLGLEFVELGDLSRVLARWSFELFAPVSVVYFTVSEGIWGTSWGKASLELRVVATDRERPGIFRSLFRSVLLLAPIYALIQINFWPSWLFVLGGLALLWARAHPTSYGPHDLLSGTRVVAQPEARSHRPAMLPGEELPADRTERIGPYQVTRDLGTPQAPLFLAYDEALQRHVWLRPAKIGAEPLPPERRALARVGRLRWLNGRRTAEEAWDAFEFVPGQPFSDVARQRVRWPEVARWLRDLVKECALAHSQPWDAAVVDPQTIWIASTGRALILDFCIPGFVRDVTASSQSVHDTTMALSRAAATLLEGKPSQDPVPQVPLPGSARKLLHDLSSARFSTYAEVTAALREVVSQPRLTRLQRLGSVSFPAIYLIMPWSAFFVDPVVAELPPLILGMSIVAVVSVVFAVLLDDYVFMSAAWMGRGTGTGYLLAVGARGRKATRVRLAVRTLAAWSPGFLALGLLLIDAGSPFVLGPLANLISLPPWIWVVPPLLLLLGACFAVVHPERGLQDRVAGTVLVPR